MPEQPLPEYVYLIKADAEWPVTAVACTEEQAPTSVASVVAKRRESTNVGPDGRVRIWRARLTELTEYGIVPERVVPASLAPKDDDS